MAHDLREALRVLAANRGFTTVIVLTLGLAIGVNSTIFSVLNGVLLRPLAYAAPDELVAIWESNPAQGLDRSQVAAATYLDWRQRARSFSAIGLSRYRGYTLTGAAEPERLVTVDVSPALFRVLGVPPLLGRTFSDEEERPGADARKVVLSHGAWVRRFGQDRSVLGRTLILDDAPHTIVGVMPRDFQYPATDPDVELWSPLSHQPRRPGVAAASALSAPWAGCRRGRRSRRRARKWRRSAPPSPASTRNRTRDGG